MKLAAVLVIVTLHSIGGAAARTSGDLGLLMPQGYQGFNPDPGGPRFFTSTDNLTGIYNGGFMTYVERGVISAFSQFYSGDSGYYQIVLHDMDSEDSASGIVGYFEGLISGGSQVETLELGDGGFRYTDFGMHYLYFSTEDLFATLEGLAGTEEAIEDSARRIEMAVSETETTIMLICLPLLALIIDKCRSRH